MLMGVLGFLDLFSLHRQEVGRAQLDLLEILVVVEVELPLMLAMVMLLIQVLDMEVAHIIVVDLLQKAELMALVVAVVVLLAVSYTHLTLPTKRIV